MGAAIARTVRPHSAPQQRTSGIETALRIPDDPTVSPRDSILGSLLRLHHQSDGANLITTVEEPIAMPPLQNEIGRLPQREPATRQRWVIHLDAMEQHIAVRLAELNQHGQIQEQR